MALVHRIFSMNCQYFRRITKPVKWSIKRQYSVRILGSGICYRSNNISRLFESQDIALLSQNIRLCSSQPEKPNAPQEQPKPGLMQKLKSMYRDYWYVTVPVHIVTSAMWFGGLYYAVCSGVDVLALLEYLGVSEKILIPLRDSSAGYVALTLAFYKVVTPLRYAVTLGGTTFAIRRLEALGWIKPMPSKARLKEMYQEKKDNFQDRRHHYQDQMKEKRSHIMDEMKRYREEIKKKVKKM